MVFRLHPEASLRGSCSCMGGVTRLVRRHVIVRLRPSCATWFVSITPTSSCIGRAKCRDPVHGLRLNQARRGLCLAETDAIRFAMALFHGFGVLPISNIVELLQGRSLCLKEGNREEEPVLRIAIDQCQNTGAKHSQRPSTGTISPLLGLSFEPDSERAGLSCGVTPRGWIIQLAQPRRRAADGVCLLITQHVPEDGRDSAHHGHASDLRPTTLFDPPIPGPHLGILLQKVQDQLPQDEPRDRAALLGDGT